MAENDQNIDLTTLKEVERLLTSTEFIGADELVQRGGLGQLAERISSDAAPEASIESGDPLPKRR